MIRVGIFPADEGGCGHYRVIWPWLAVARQFPDEIEVIYDNALEDEMLFAWEGGPFDEPTEYHRPVSIQSLPDIDVMVFQRPLHSKFVDSYRLLREAGIFVVVDLDDNFDRIDKRNIAWYGVEPHWMHENEVKLLANMFGRVNVTRRGGDGGKFLFTAEHMGAINRKNVREALKHVDLLTVSTPSLAAAYGGLAHRTVVLENCVEEWYFEQEHVVNDPPVVGWTGSIATHPNDLEQMGATLPQLRRKHVPFLFKVVGTGVGVRNATGLQPDVTTEGWVDLQGEYQREYATMDIALCPLEDIDFNYAKSWLKPLEAASLGVLPLMSATPEYMRMNSKGVGVVARKPRDWEGVLKRLLSDPSRLQELTVSSQEAARPWTYDKQAHRWAQALLDGLKVRVSHASRRSD